MKIGVQKVFEKVTDLAAIAPQLIVDYAGFGTTTAEALEAIAVGGRVVQVGMGRLEATINTRTLILKAAELVGSVGGNTEDIKAVYGLFASGSSSRSSPRFPSRRSARG